MAAVLVLLLNAAIAVKTASYGVWETKRENIKGGIFAVTLAALNLFLAIRYLIKYWA